jgi:hypothetical protein
VRCTEDPVELKDKDLAAGLEIGNYKYYPEIDLKVRMENDNEVKYIRTTPGRILLNEAFK